MRYALRNLARTPCFALTAILTLALGIGLATAVFTVADALLLRRLPVRDQDRLVVLWSQAPDRGFDYPFTLDEAREFARRTRSLAPVAFFAREGAWPTPIRDGERISRLRRALVSGEFFDALGRNLCWAGRCTPRTTSSVPHRCSCSAMALGSGSSGATPRCWAGRS